MSGLSIPSDSSTVFALTVGLAVALVVLSAGGWFLRRRVSRKLGVEKEGAAEGHARQREAWRQMKRMERPDQVPPRERVQLQHDVLKESAFIGGRQVDYHEARAARLRPLLRLLSILNFITTVGAVAAIAAAAIAYAQSDFERVLTFDFAGLAFTVIKLLLTGAIQAVGGIIVRRLYDATKRKPASRMPARSR